jgi:hypothetical protein
MSFVAHPALLFSTTNQRSLLNNAYSVTMIFIHIEVIVANIVLTNASGILIALASTNKLKVGLIVPQVMLSYDNISSTNTAKNVYYVDGTNSTPKQTVAQFNLII